MSRLTDHELGIIKHVQRTGDWDMFTEYFFRLPFSGTWYTPEDRVEYYAMLHELWRKLGKPDEEFKAVIEVKETPIKVVYDNYYGTEPIFLLPHGYRTLPWMTDFLAPRITKAAAVTGAGTGKTCGVAIRALAYCAIMPGFRVLNVAPTQWQADLILGEIEKWCSDTPFRKLVRPSRGVSELWTNDPYPTITVEVDERYPATFICQTTGREGKTIIGGERDWINVDEAQLLVTIEEVEPILVTRLRGTRVTGLPRWSKLTWISNPGPNPEWMSLLEKYQSLVDAGETGVLTLSDLDTQVNIYVTKRQLQEQRRTLSERQQDRWIGGQMSAVYSSSHIGEDLVERCRDKKLDARIEKIGKYTDDMGLVEYELPYDPTRNYVVVGDTGKSLRTSLSSMNVPCIMALDVTDFMEIPSPVVGFWWLDGQNTYQVFEDKFKYATMKYRCQGYYDATNIQSAFEDTGGFSSLPFTHPILFSGTAANKRWALATTVLMLQRGMLAFPYIKGLWYQARIYDPSNRRIPDDIIATLLVFANALRYEGALWNRFMEKFDWDEEYEGLIDRAKDDGGRSPYEDEEVAVRRNRYSRAMA